ncbi:hypothetical protein [Kiritimatiella glycovorans]|uniref:Nucleotidyl transferase AbiEii toxin, Type IV TA system n=1 Tax=Kiritimatiella glycovorans TaxID=1307763 RepID=A0A0G3ELN0_9BACT|nr:hypothetical protein [Kiritimatiella glycovorans]AKJ65059.1 hypothetical protein L21SP4_01822 [Kiritimatiella glycovorans]
MRHLRTIILALSDAEVDYVIGGGVACVLQGVERFTLDLDVAVRFTEGNMRRFIKVMEDLGLKPRVPLEPETLLDPETIRMIVEEKHAVVFSFLDPKEPARHLDLFLKEELSFEAFDEDADEVDVEGRRVRVASKSRLLSLKQRIDPPRDKDLLDIAALEHLLAGGRENG